MGRCHEVWSASSSIWWTVPLQCASMQDGSVLTIRLVPLQRNGLTRIPSGYCREWAPYESSLQPAFGWWGHGGAVASHHPLRLTYSSSIKSVAWSDWMAPSPAWRVAIARATYSNARGGAAMRHIPRYLRPRQTSGNTAERHSPSREGRPQWNPSR